jgi:hypothetical protein
MIKYYLSLEQEAQQANVTIDEFIEQLIQKQQYAGFGFCEYWQQGYTLEAFCGKYQSDFMQRIPQEKRQELEYFVEGERKRQNNLMVGKREIFFGKVRLGVYKILWRAFRRIGFPGTKSKGHLNAVNDGCFLCIQNTPDQQKGMRIIGTDDSMNYVVLMNPFPILTDQVTIASLRHEPQRLREQHIEYVMQLTERSEKFKYSFNGIGAGASIPHHFHFYGFTGSLPIEEIACPVAVIKAHNLSVYELGEDWPIITFVAMGGKSEIGSYLLDLTSHLEQQNISVNVVFVRDKNSNAKVYVIPRRKPKPEPQTGFNNDFGVIEMSGVLVCESTEAFESADTGNIVEAMRQVGYPNTESGRTRFLYDLLGPGRA